MRGVSSPWTHPVSRATRARGSGGLARSPLRRKGRAASAVSCASAAGARSPSALRRSGRTSPSRRNFASTRAGARSARSTGGRATTCSRKNMRADHDRGRDPEPVATMAARASSMMAPNGTPEGQAVSQARHCRQRSRCGRTRSFASMRPSRIAPMRCNRPRGDSSSEPVAMYVGHVGRQNPQ